MSTQDDEPGASALADEALDTPAATGGDAAETETEAEAAKPKLELDVEISDAGPCKKHLKIAIARTDIDRQFDESLGSVKREAAVPGFRPGHAPKTHVQKRFKKEVAGQVKSALLMGALEQLDSDYKINPISQPELDLEAIELPDDGPMRFEFDVEVQPDFPLPDYKSLTVKRFVREVTEADVDAQLKAFLERYGQIVPRFEGGAEIGDFITADLRFQKDGVVLNTVKEIQFRLQPELRFQDGRVPELAGALAGVRPGDVRDADAIVDLSSADHAIRGQTIGVTFHVHDLKTMRMPEVNTAFLQSIGFDSEAELRDALHGVLERRYEYQQRQAMRRELLDQLMTEVPFDLPSELVARQEMTTLRSRVQEMRQAGLSDAQIRARESELRANVRDETRRSLKEFFLLSKIADAEDIKVEDEDIEQEIESIAARTDESPRRVRARIQKEGLADSVSTQLLERKTIDRILDYVKQEVVPLAAETDVETLDEAATVRAPDEAEPSTEEQVQDESQDNGLAAEASSSE
jgi:trigger factor